MQRNSSTNFKRAVKGSVIKYLAASPPGYPVTVSPDGVFLVVLNEDSEIARIVA